MASGKTVASRMHAFEKLRERQDGYSPWPSFAIANLAPLICSCRMLSMQPLRQQAAEQGDADKVGKKRKKSKAAAEEEQVFGEERTAADRAAALRETGTPVPDMASLEAAQACMPCFSS